MRITFFMMGLLLTFSSFAANKTKITCTILDRNELFEKEPVVLVADSAEYTAKLSFVVYGQEVVVRTNQSSVAICNKINGLEMCAINEAVFYPPHGQVGEDTSVQCKLERY